MAPQDDLHGAGKAWNVLVAAAGKNTNLYYTELADAISYNPRNLTWVLNPIQAYCLDQDLPPLTILAVDKQTGEPGSGFTAVPKENRADALREVLAYAWEREPNPFALALEGHDEGELIDKILAGREQAGDVYRLAKYRGPQQRLFRHALLEAYGGRCAFSGSTFVPMLEAAHIVPWSYATAGERLDVQNGLLLNTYFHRLFDLHILRLKDDYHIALAPDTNLSSFEEFDRSAIESIVGKRILLPRFVRHHPAKDLIRRRNAGIG